MKVGLITIAIVSLAFSAARGVPFEGLNIQEVNENLVATFNGGAASFVTITQTSADFWTITLSPGWTLDVAFPFDVEIGEPEGGITPNGLFLENFIHFADETTILWDSEHETDIPNGTLPLFDVLPDELISPSGERFDVRVADVPESGFTLSLLGIGLVGLAWFARFRRTAT
jgi:hypothetical protein